MFNQGGTKVFEEDQSGRPSRITVDLKEKVEQKIYENRQFTKHFT